jgi:hypothetical protein
MNRIENGNSSAFCRAHGQDGGMIVVDLAPAIRATCLALRKIRSFCLLRYS